LVVLLEIFFPTQGGRVQSFGIPFHLSMCVMLALQLSVWRIQITEGGVQYHLAILRWKNIAAWSWTKGGTLKLSLKGRFQPKHSVYIPASQREAVEELMAQHCAMHGEA
jgi:hypothetical protein